MKPLFFAALLLVGCATGPVSTPVPPAAIEQKCSSAEHLPRAQRELVGMWKHVELIRVIDGNRLSPQSIPGANIANFYCNGTWESSGPNYRSAGTFKWISDDAIEETVVESNLAIQIGLVTVKKITVDERRLEIQIAQTPQQRAQIMPPPNAGTRREITTLVITRFERTGS